MKLPNFRLYSTQATAGIVLAIGAVVLVSLLAYCVLRGIDLQNWLVRYSEREGLGRFRNYAVVGLTGLAILMGSSAAILGFSSLGQKRNAYPSRSWASLGLGALVAAIAPVLWFAWRYLREAV